MEQNLPLLSLIDALRGGPYDPIAALRGNFDLDTALRGKPAPLTTLLQATPQIKQLTPAAAQSAMYLMSEPTSSDSGMR